jgi:hypothetical protein
MSTADEWAKGYARQASADFTTWSWLQGRDAIPACHKLLFLQMACEKLTKAHLCKLGSDPKQLQTSRQLHVPLDWSFAPAGLLVAPAGRTFLKLVRESIDRFL